MSNLPIILVAAIDHSKCTDVIERIINTDGISDISRAGHVQNGRTICKINTKYYTAKSEFYSIDSTAASLEDVINRTEAVVLFLDHSIDSTDSLMKELKEWESIVSTIAAEAKVLVSKDIIPENQEQAVTAWCIDNEFELVKLEHEKDPISDNMVCDEKFGIERVVEILQTHRWSNLRQKMIVNMTERLTEYKPPGLSEHKPLELPKSTFDRTSTIPHFPACNPSPPANTEFGTPQEEALEDLQDPEDVIQIYHEDDMQKLFQDMQSMKQNMSSLSRTEKLDRAEEMVKKIWSAIGGDMDEFSDCDDGAA